MSLTLDDRGVVLPCPSCGRHNRVPFGREAKCGHCGSLLPPPAQPVEVPTAVLFDALIRESRLPVVVDFWAPWCGPCRGFAPVFEKASETHQDVVFAKVNTDEQQELAGAFDIRSIPTLMVFREKVILFQQPGALPGAALEQVITQAKTVDMVKVHAEVNNQK